MLSRSSRICRSSIISRTPFFYGWVILAASALTRFISSPGQSYLVSVFIDPIISELGWSRTLVSGLYTAGSLTAGVAMIFVGRLLDRYGARTMLLAVGILFGFTALWMSTVDHPVKLYFGFAALRTLGQGSLSLIPSTLIALWFVRLRGRAIAIGGIGEAIGMQNGGTGKSLAMKILRYLRNVVIIIHFLLLLRNFHHLIFLEVLFLLLHQYLSLDIP